MQVSRLLERMVKESGMVDVESLCVQAGRRVWEVTVEVAVVDEDGSVADAASVAVLSALLLASRPDVSLSGDALTLHPASERDPVPLSLYHHPVAVTIGLLKPAPDSDSADLLCIADPSWREERVLDGTLVFVFNTRKELCAIHSTGSLLLTKDLVRTTLLAYTNG